ncbi:hypothetical protein [Actinosynnema sp. NPDC020468]|uniref:hypothetical protein n=1 Tax=Actinosynnema sp. NPDC020468 TaxID=3154488 RepID=UPI0033EB3C83
MTRPARFLAMLTDGSRMIAVEHESEVDAEAYGEFGHRTWLTFVGVAQLVDAEDVVDIAGPAPDLG